MVVIRLYRVIPLIIALAVIALVAYAVISYFRSPQRAKEILIAVFSRLSAGGTVLCLIATLYALVDGNPLVAELALSCAAIFAVCLGIVLACRAVFLKRHPECRKKPQRARLIGKEK